MPDINEVIREARQELREAYDKASLARYAHPRLSAHQLDVLVSEALWNRSLGISSAGRYNATAAAVRNEAGDYEFEHADPEPFGRYMQPKPSKPRRKRGQARAETASLVDRIVAKWLAQYSALGSSTGTEKLLADFTAAEFRDAAVVKRRLAGTYEQQATGDERIATMMDTLHVERAADLPVESLYQVIKDYRPVSASPASDDVEADDIVAVQE